MMSRTDGDALTVEKISHFLGRHAIQHERQNTGLLFGRADDAQPGDALQRAVA
jgi:hypothetical protein